MVEVMLYADHVAAVAAAREDERGKTIVSYDLMKQRKSYEQGQRDEREACIAAVEGCKWADFGIDPTDYDMDGDYWRDQAAAAIRAREEKP